MSKNLSPEDMLAEVEDVLRTMPPRSTLHHDTPEVEAWLGRAVTIIARWDSIQGGSARAYLSQLNNPMAATSHAGEKGLVGLLHQARSDLRLSTLGPINTAIGHGLTFDYFDEIRQLIETAKSDVLFVDPYLDANFVSRYLHHVGQGVAIRLLGRHALPALFSAITMFVQQTKTIVTLRSSDQLHDRYIFIDGNSCYQSGASFKDGGANAPTTITQITDAFLAVRQTYETLWQNGRPVH